MHLRRLLVSHHLVRSISSQRLAPRRSRFFLPEDQDDPDSHEREKDYDQDDKQKKRRCREDPPDNIEASKRDSIPTLQADRRLEQ
jgi:hypothetical protein